MSLIVFGSINLDLVIKTPRLLLPGKTYLVAPVGNDTFGQKLLRILQESGVICDRVLVSC